MIWNNNMIWTIY